MIVNGTELPAVTCPQCGCKLYPAALLPGHMDRHRLLLVQAIGNGAGWNYGSRPKTHKANPRGRPRLKASERVKKVAIPKQERGAYQ